jgi:hypothetical protein
MLGYVVVIVIGAFVGGGCFGAAWWWLGQQQPIADAGPSAEEIATRHQLRNQIGDLIQRGRIYQTNLLAIASRQMPEVEKVVGPLVTNAMHWHMEVIRFAETNISHADAMRISVPAPSLQPPEGLLHSYLEENGKTYGGYDLRSTWDFVLGDLGNLLGLPEIGRVVTVGTNVDSMFRPRLMCKPDTRRNQISTVAARVRAGVLIAEITDVVPRHAFLSIQN